MRNLNVLPYIFIIIEQEATQDVNGQNLQSKQHIRKTKTKAAEVTEDHMNRLTLNPLSDLMSIIVSTVSYRIALPTFLLVSVFVATCVHTSAVFSVANRVSSRGSANRLLIKSHLCKDVVHRFT